MPRGTWQCFTIAVVLVVAALFVEAQKPSGTPAAGTPERGKAFFQRDCAICHTVGRGKQIGPDLLGVTRRRTHRWLVTMIQHPGELMKRHDPTAVALFKKYAVEMPDLHVNDAERDDLIAYFEAEAAAHEKTAAKQ